MKTLQEVLLIFYQKWKIQVKQFSQSKQRIFEVDKNKYKKAEDFPFDKIKPQEVLSWLDYSSQGWIILSSDLTIKYINQKALTLIRFFKYKDVIGKAINDINELEVLRNKILYSKKKDFPISIDFTISGDPLWANIVRGSKKNYLILLESKLSIESIKKRQNQLINDVSHELWVKNWLSITTREYTNDQLSKIMIIGVSSSGYSKNICLFIIQLYCICIQISLVKFRGNLGEINS